MLTFVGVCCFFAERGALLGLVGDVRSLADLAVRLLGWTKAQTAESRFHIAPAGSTAWLRLN